MYPQSDVSFAIVYIDALKGFVDLWVHFFVAIEDIHRNGYRQKRCFFCFDKIQTCFIFPLRWVSFPIKICRNTQWEFDDFFTIYLIV